MFELSYVLNALSAQNLTVIVVGTLIGVLFGSIPGLGAQITLVLLLPFSFQMEPLSAILMLLAAYQGCEYGGSISSIILGIPGTPLRLRPFWTGISYHKRGNQVKLSVIP
jgi:putative tricarboxylic transport membrane protein